MKLHITSLMLLCLVMAAVPAMAQNDLYDNGPVNGQDLGWTINLGFTVSDSFTLSSSSDVIGVQFWAWLIPGDTLTSVEVQLGSAAFGNELFDQTVNFTASNCFSNQFGYNVCDETATFNGGGLNLGAGTYWMTLSNANVPGDDPAYWDMNSGPSLAQENMLGTIPSESFTMLGEGCGAGNNAPACGPPTPEPDTFLLLGSGIVGLAVMLGLKIRR